MSSSIRHRIRFAQNFLTDPGLVDRLLDASHITDSDRVYEIGSGNGIITERLAHRCRQVVAIEKDPRLAGRLQRRFAGRPNLTVRAGDFLKMPLPAAPYKVFASIPFNQTAAIVTRLTRAAQPPDEQYLVVQREAAERFMGRPASTLYALLLAPWFETDITFRFRRADFTPPPGVEVVLLRIAKRGPPLISAEDARLYRDFTVALFTAWRPSAASALEQLCGRHRAQRLLAETGIDPRAKPSELAPEQWQRLFHAFAQGGGPASRLRIADAEDHLQRQQAQLRKLHRTRIRTTGPAPPLRTMATVACHRSRTVDTPRPPRTTTSRRRPALHAKTAQFPIVQRIPPVARPMRYRTA